MVSCWSQSVFQSINCKQASLTFWKETGGPVHYMPPKVPAIAKIIITLNELNAIAFGKTQLIRAASFKVMNYQ